MSSKSRNRPPRQERHASPTAKAEDGSEHAEPTAEEFLEAEELLKTPKGRSPLTYAFLIFLLIFLLVVFLAADAFYAVPGQQGVRDVVMRWDHPSKGTQSVTRIDFERMRRTLGVIQGQRNVEPEQVASFMVADSIATEAGVTVSDAELVQALIDLSDQTGGTDNYKAAIARSGIPGGVSAFEETMRRVRRIGRYRALLGSMNALPDPTEIESTWADQHQLRTFDYSYTTIADQVERALAENPDDAALQAWFDGRPDYERNQYQTPASQRVEFIGVDLSDPTRSFDTLLAAYPAADDTDIDARAQEYYDTSYFARFKRPEPLEAPEDGSIEDFQSRVYFTFDEVVEDCLREAAIKDALLVWRANVDADLAAGVEVDFAAEAERLGIDYLAPEAPLSQVELRELGGLGGLYVAGQIAGLTEPGGVTADVTVNSASLSTARLIEKFDATIPPLAEIREDVLTAWADERAVELATETLADVRATLAPESEEDSTAMEADYEAFSAAVAAAGLPLERLARFDRADRPTAGEEDTPEVGFLRSLSQLYNLEPGAVTEPVKSFDNERVYLIRLESIDDPDPSAMTAKDFQQLFSQQVQFAQFMAQMDDPFAVDSLRARYGLWLITDDAEAAADSAAEDSGAEESAAPAEGTAAE